MLSTNEAIFVGFLIGFIFAGLLLSYIKKNKSYELPKETREKIILELKADPNLGQYLQDL